MHWRIQIAGARLFRFITRWPVRLWRLWMWILWIRIPSGPHRVLRWLLGIILLLVDLTPLSFIYETLMDIVKYRSRPMTPAECALAITIFGNKLPLHLITIDPDSIPVKKNRTGAYVSFHTVNYHKEILDQVLIHELVHIWQYEKYGSVYISEAIWAQQWGGGYDYGGLEPLLKYSEGKGLASFNFEQQADIIEDYYRWQNGLPLQWALNVPGIGEVLEKYKNEVM